MLNDSARHPGLNAPFGSAPRAWWQAMLPVEIAVDERAGGATLSAIHVLNLADSIAALGLLEPLIVDCQGRLLAGAHRLAALQLLAIADPEERVRAFAEAGDPATVVDLGERVRRLDATTFLDFYPGGRIPVLVVDTSGDEDLATTVRVVEVAARQQWRIDIAQELRKGGFVARHHVPGARARRPASEPVS
jgi:hypothetical protein